MGECKWTNNANNINRMPLFLLITLVPHDNMTYTKMLDTFLQVATTFFLGQTQYLYI